LSEVSLLRDQLKQAHEFLKMTTADLTVDQANWAPPGEANPIGATLLHIYGGEDFFVAMIAQSQPLGAGGRSFGVTEPPEAGFVPGTWHDWARRTKVESLEMLHAYGAEVFAATDKWLSSLTDNDISREINFSQFGFGKQPLSWVISNGVLGHRMSHWGEISCLKGLQGGKGFPV
jgi:hypothetical protein